MRDLECFFKEFFSEVVGRLEEGNFRAWFRDSFLGLVAGLFQVRLFIRYGQRRLAQETSPARWRLLVFRVYVLNSRRNDEQAADISPYSVKDGAGSVTTA